jgi:hypothetical protein
MNLSGIFEMRRISSRSILSSIESIFTKDVCSKIDGLSRKLSEACSSLVFFFQEAAAIKVTNDQIWDLWKRAMDTIESEVPKIKELPEQSFRELLWRTTYNQQRPETHDSSLHQTAPAVSQSRLTRRIRQR